MPGDHEKREGKKLLVSSGAIIADYLTWLTNLGRICSPEHVITLAQRRTAQHSTAQKQKGRPGIFSCPFHPQAGVDALSPGEDEER